MSIGLTDTRRAQWNRTLQLPAIKTIRPRPRRVCGQWWMWMPIDVLPNTVAFYGSSSSSLSCQQRYYWGPLSSIRIVTDAPFLVIVCPTVGIRSSAVADMERGRLAHLAFISAVIIYLALERITKTVAITLLHKSKAQRFCRRQLSFGR